MNRLKYLRRSDSWSRRWILVFLVVVLMNSRVDGFNCICNPLECETLEPSGCPGMGVIVYDPCRCCKVCARTPGEHCGGFQGTCEPGLRCRNGICVPIL